VPLDSDDSIAVVISTDGGLTWSSNNTLAVFTAADGIIGGTQGFATKFITLTDTGIVKIGFYATNGNTANTQNTDVMFDNIGILAQCSNPLFASITDTFPCESGSVTISLGASSTYNYNWSNGGTTNMNTFLSAGTYNVIVTDDTCATVDTFNIEQLTAPVINGINTQGTVPTFQFGVDGTTDAHTTYTWNFGDSTTANDANPSHTFPTTTIETTYDVTVIVSHPCGTDTAATTITVQGSTIHSSKAEENNILVYPNPSKHFITIDARKVAKIEEAAVLNLLGQTVLATRFSPSHTVTLDLGNLANGSYLLKIETEAGVAIKQISINKYLR
jgi:hypothetical protein